MTSIVRKAHSKGLIKPPPFVMGGVQYEVMTGSQAYGTHTEQSDRDIYGFCMPPKEMVFPHLGGEIPDFGYQQKRFEQFSTTGYGQVDMDGTQYDISIYNIFSCAWTTTPT